MPGIGKHICNEPLPTKSSANAVAVAEAGDPGQLTLDSCLDPGLAVSASQKAERTDHCSDAQSVMGLGHDASVAGGMQAEHAAVAAPA